MRNSASVELSSASFWLECSSWRTAGWETEFARVVDGSYFPDFTAEMMAKDIELGQNLAKKHNVPMLIHGQARAWRVGDLSQR